MKIRILSGVIGALLAILTLVLYKTFFFPLVIALLICLALYELYRAGECLHCRISVCAGMLYGVALPFLTYYGNTTAVIAIAFFSVVLMAFELVLLHKHVTFQEVLFIAAVTYLVTGSLNTIISLLHFNQYGIACVVLALCSAWIADTGAYFFGTFLGKHKLCPEISPKKTTEGFFGGIFTDVVIMVVFALIYSRIAQCQVHYLWLIFAAIVCAVVSVLGDLSASVLKRQQGIKDFGNIMPGHGGIMDRIDSVLFTVPAFYVLTCMYPIFF